MANVLQIAGGKLILAVAGGMRRLIRAAADAACCCFNCACAAEVGCADCGDGPCDTPGTVTLAFSDDVDQILGCFNSPSPSLAFDPQSLFVAGALAGQVFTIPQFEDGCAWAVFQFPETGYPGPYPVGVDVFNALGCPGVPDFTTNGFIIQAARVAGAWKVIVRAVIGPAGIDARSYNAMVFESEATASADCRAEVFLPNLHSAIGNPPVLATDVTGQDALTWGGGVTLTPCFLEPA